MGISISVGRITKNLICMLVVICALASGAENGAERLFQMEAGGRTVESYSGGARVSYQSAIWQAGWVTGAAPPERNDAWKLVSAIPVPWSAQRPYDGGNQVHHQGNVYRAGWWVVGAAPPASPWTDRAVSVNTVDASGRYGFP